METASCKKKTKRKPKNVFFCFVFLKAIIMLSNQIIKCQNDIEENAELLKGGFDCPPCPRPTNGHFLERVESQKSFL